MTQESFFNRDLSWLEFNRRVLLQSRDSRFPLLERVRFLSIFTSNLDEFFMKRVGRLQRMVVRDVQIAGPDGLYPGDAMREIRAVVNELLAEQASIYQQEILPELADNGIRFCEWSQLDDEEREQLNRYFQEKVFPILTPLAVDSSHPFPFLSNLSLSLGLKVQSPRADEALFARVKIPDALRQIIALPMDSNRAPFKLVRLIDIIHHNLHELFPGMDITAVTPFRITRNADIPLDDEDQDDVVELVEEELRRRRMAHVVRLEHSAGSDPWVLDILRREIGLRDESIFPMEGELDFRALSDICRLEMPELKFRTWVPVTPTRLLDEETNIIGQIKEGDIFVHHPYESFSASVERFIREAVEDRDVFAIKMTLYRTGPSSPFIPLLIEAAEAGKQVVCVVEVKARFDEARNLYWAEKLEKAGVHVVYGVYGLKTHAKIALVVRREKDYFQPYAHIGTGNYNDQTANLYTDFGLFTNRKEITSEIIEVFNSLTGISLHEGYKTLLVSPVNMRERFLRLIQEEIENQQAGRPSGIVAKMNSLEDTEICSLLYQASQAGVPVQLIVRGFCSLQPGVKGLSENIQVMSVIGRFLEHTRLYYFRAGAESPEDGMFYFGSADWMRRNINDRVEVIAPVLERPIRKRVWEMLQVYLNDQVETWDLRNDGTYLKRKNTGSDSKGVQEMLMRQARDRSL